MTDYEDEDSNLKLYEECGKPFNIQIYQTILKRLDNYKCSEIPSKLQDELLDRLNKLYKLKTT